MCGGQFGRRDPDREFERSMAEADEVATAERERDRRADHTPVRPRVLETPLDELKAYVRSAAQCRRNGDIGGLMRWLEMAEDAEQRV